MDYADPFWSDKVEGKTFGVCVNFFFFLKVSDPAEPGIKNRLNKKNKTKLAQSLAPFQGHWSPGGGSWLALVFSDCYFYADKLLSRSKINSREKIN